MSEYTKDRLLASMSVPVSNRNAPGFLCTQTAPDLLGACLRLSAHYDATAIQAIFESSGSLGSPSDWTVAWAWRVSIATDGALRLEQGGAHGAHAAELNALPSIESAKALFRAAAQQMGCRLEWSDAPDSRPGPSLADALLSWESASLAAFKTLTRARRQSRSRPANPHQKPGSLLARSDDIARLKSATVAGAQSDWIQDSQSCSVSRPSKGRTSHSGRS